MSSGERRSADHGPLARRVLEFEKTVKRLVTAAKQPGFTSADWAPLAELVAVDEFERVGPWREVMSWQEYTDFLTRWASSTEFETTLRRISELPGLVFLELEERNAKADGVTVVNSLSVYEFDDAGKIRHLDIYLQRER